MYADDNIVCCLLPNKCNLFPQTAVVIFLDTMEYINIIIVLCLPIIIVWSLLQIMLQFVKKYQSELIVQNDSKDSCLVEQSLERDVETKCTDELSDENNSDGYSDKPCSDSDLNVSNSIQRRLNNKDGLSSNCNNSHLDSSEEQLIGNVDMTNPASGRSSNSVRQNYNSSTSDEGEERNHNMEHLEQHDFKFGIHRSILNIVPEEQSQFPNVSQEDTNNDKPRSTIQVSDTDSINQQQRQKKHSDHPT